jgi:predicted Zn-dependent peptidase
VFGTKYGSIDNSFRKKGEEEFIDVPEGIAHFLEHKLFESEDGDAFAKYAKTGASANAYTSFDKTCYLFSCSDKFEESFEVLLDFVQHPYFTQATVEKEQGIIGQEISMYDDSPDWIVLFNTLESLYHNNPVRINIAGTAQTIAKINADLLYQCYHTFYNLQNMFIVVCGNVSTDTVVDLCEKHLKEQEGFEVETKPYNEPYEIVRSYKEQQMPVAIPQFMLGIKMDCEGYLPTKERIEISMLISLLVGSQSKLYNQMLSDGFINKEFGASLFDGRNFASILFSGESKVPNKVVETLKETILTLQKDGIDPEEFELIRKQYYGRYIMAFNNVEGIGDALTDCACDGSGLFDEISIFENMTVNDLNQRLKTAFDLNRCALSVITPIGN